MGINEVVTQQKWVLSDLIVLVRNIIIYQLHSSVSKIKTGSTNMIFKDTNFGKKTTDHPNHPLDTDQ